MFNNNGLIVLLKTAPSFRCCTIRLDKGCSIIFSKTCLAVETLLFGFDLLLNSPNT